ncbi:MAG: rhomboid family intramembrane serine protease [Isosphaerales bacterium]
MERGQGFEVSAGSWDAFALAAIAPLGPFTQVHLAPKLPPALLNAALGTYLSLESDELLLALIEGGARSPDGCCALTTRRLYWAKLERGDKTARSDRAPARGRSSGRTLVCHAALYAGLPEMIEELGAADGSFRFELGSGRTLVLNRADARLAQTLARYLETMGKAARTGISPSLGEIDEQLAARIPRILPAIEKVTSRARTLTQDLVRFRSALYVATPRVFITPAFILACVAVFAAMVAFGVPVLSPTGPELVDWGANEGVRIVLRREYWRLLTSVFVHGGLIHLAMNMWSLFVIGPLVERLYGNWAFAVLYVAAGLGGAIASVAASPLRIGVGASGAICGVLGALLAFLITHRRSIPVSLLKSLRANVLAIIVFMVILGKIVPNIDQEAHLGGLATGFVCGLLLSRPLFRVSRWWVVARRIVVSVLIAGAMAGTAIAVARRAVTSLSPSVRLRDIGVQIAPALDEFNAIDEAMPGTLVLKRDRGDPPDQQKHLHNIQELAQRGTANLARLRRATTPVPSLRIMVDELIQAQNSQLGGLRASRRFLETGNTDDLTGPDGVLALRAATTQSKRAFQKQQYKYLSEHGLVAQ